MENSIYKLIVINYFAYGDDKPQYPDFELSYDTLGYFSSIANAEQVMKEYMKGYIEKYGDSERNTF